MRSKETMMDKLIAALTILAIMVFIGFLLSWPVMFLWNNCLVGAVAGISEITWLQAWGIKILFSILVKTNVTSKD